MFFWYRLTRFVLDNY